MTSYRMGRAAGYISIVGPDEPPKEFDSLQCVHCGGHWYMESGSGKQRGFCTMCNGPHCGQPGCWACIPLEKRLKELERRAAFAAEAGLVTE
jgi:hypothetical protein